MLPLANLALVFFLDQAAFDELFNCIKYEAHIDLFSFFLPNYFSFVYIFIFLAAVLIEQRPGPLPLYVTTCRDCCTGIKER